MNYVLSLSDMSDILQPMDCSPPGSSVHGDSPGKNTGVGSHSLLRGIIPTQASNPGVLHYRQILYCLSHQRCPRLDLKAQLCHSTELCYWVTYLTTLGLLLLILKIEIIIVPIL